MGKEEVCKQGKLKPRKKKNETMKVKKKKRKKIEMIVNCE